MSDLVERLRRRAGPLEALADAWAPYSLSWALEAKGAMERAAKDSEEAAAEIERLRAALSSIARNTCCDGCQEAARVAETALAGRADPTGTGEG